MKIRRKSRSSPGGKLASSGAAPRAGLAFFYRRSADLPAGNPSVRLIMRADGCGGPAVPVLCLFTPSSSRAAVFLHSSMR
jgi:hypothetical protein